MQRPRRSILVWLVVGSFAALLLASSGRSASAFSNGQVGHSGSPDVGGATCANCHGGAEQSATVRINAPTSMRVGESATVSVTVAGGPGGAEALAGFNAATRSSAGTITASSPSSKVLQGEATHAQATALVNGEARFDFTWTAPAEPTTVELYAAGVSADGAGDRAGDAVATALATIVVEPEPEPTVEATTPRRPVVIVTPTPTPEPADAPAIDVAGPFGFGLNPVPAEPPPRMGAATGEDVPALAATGNEATGGSSIAIVLLATGAVAVVFARRVARG